MIAPKSRVSSRERSRGAGAVVKKSDDAGAYTAALARFEHAWGWRHSSAAAASSLSPQRAAMSRRIADAASTAVKEIDVRLAPPASARFFYGTEEISATRTNPTIQRP